MLAWGVAGGWQLEDMASEVEKFWDTGRPGPVVGEWRSVESGDQRSGSPEHLAGSSPRDGRTGGGHLWDTSWCLERDYVHGGQCHG